MMIKLFLILLIIIFINKVESKKSIRKLLIVQDKEMDKNGFSQFSILNSNGKEYLYRLKTSYDYHEQLLIITYPSQNLIGYLEGDWKNETLNVIFYIYDSINDQWLNGTIEKIQNLFMEKYLIKWNNESFLMKKKLLSINYSFYDNNQNTLALYTKRFRWFNWSLVKYDLKIFIDLLPDPIYLFILAILDHRNIIL